MNQPSTPKRIGLHDHLIGLCLASGYVSWLLATARNLGFPRDEGFYFRAATDYARWFRLLFRSPSQAFSQATIDSMWSYNHEHPALMKSLFALSWLQFHERWHLFEDASTAFRLPGMIMGGLTLWVTYLFGARAYSRRAGLVAACSLALMPHVFFHAHLACFDVPVMAMWTWCIYVYWRSQQSRTLAWALLAGLAYGLTLETKHNAWVLPAVILPHAFFLHRREFLLDLRRGRISIPTNLLFMATVGPAVFIALWPWMWSNTIPRIQEYVQFHVHHDYYNIEFFHKNYFGPPSPKAWAPFMILATVPSVTLLCFAVGCVDRLKRGVDRLWGWVTVRGSVRARSYDASVFGRATEGEDTETDLLVGLAFAAAVAPFFLKTTPIFGGTKHWMTGYPFLALLAGRGFDVVCGAMEGWCRRRGTSFSPAYPVALAASVLVAPLAITVHSHPFGLSAYVPLVGGPQGAADLGLYRSFWGYTTQNAAPFLATVPLGSRVFFHDTAWDSWYRMLDEKRLRPDLHGVGSPSEADYAFVHYELHMLESEYQNWVATETLRPEYLVRQDDVPIAAIYHRP